METAIIVVLILVIIKLARFIKLIFTAEKMKVNSHVVCATGSMGTGKTAHSVKQGLIQNIWKNNKVGKKRREVYSNIPIRLNKNTWSKKLSEDILRGDVRVEEGSIIFIDEISSYINQYKSTGIEAQLQSLFLKLSRQFADCYWVLTEQNASNIPAHFRRRINRYYCFTGSTIYLHTWISSTFYIVDTQDGLYTKILQEDEGEKHTFMLFGFKHYDSRAFKNCYLELPLNNNERWNNYQMPTDTYEDLKKLIKKNYFRKDVKKCEDGS